MSCIHKKFVCHAIANAATAAITKPIGESKKAKAPAIAENAAVIAGKTIQIDPTTSKSPANPAATPPIIDKVVCISGLNP